jgi:hypothetical protein
MERLGHIFQPRHMHGAVVACDFDVARVYVSSPRHDLDSATFGKTVVLEPASDRDIG